MAVDLFKLTAELALPALLQMQQHRFKQVADYMFDAQGIDGLIASLESRNLRNAQAKN